MPTTTHTIMLAPIGDVDVTVAESGAGQPILLLHGGGGPQTVLGFAQALADDPRTYARVLSPTHPGFDGTSRPDVLESIGGLAALYVALLESLDLHDVIVVGNSIGGWITAEMALLGSDRVSRYVLVDAVGIEVAAHPSTGLRRGHPGGPV
jgi:pimeloyl-ACP methyl ester carboxylesterase